MAPTRESEQARMRPVVTTDRARQGKTGHNVRYVLIGSTLAIIIAFALIYVGFFTA